MMENNNIPFMSYITKCGIKLGNWINTQKAYKRKAATKRKAAKRKAAPKKKKKAAKKRRR